MLFQTLLSSAATSIYYSVSVSQLSPFLGVSSSSLLRTTLEDLRSFCKGARNWPNCSQNLHTLIPNSHDYGLISYRLHLQGSASILILEMPPLSLTSLIPITIVRAPLVWSNFTTDQPCGKQSIEGMLLTISGQALNVNNHLFFRIKFTVLLINFKYQSVFRPRILLLERQQSQQGWVFRGRMNGKFGGLAAVCSKLDFSIIRIYYLVSIGNVVS